MNESQTDNSVFDLGTWLGRKQAFGLISSRCLVADIECLAEIRENKRYRSLGVSWSEFCSQHLGITARWADMLIRRLETLGPDFFKLNSFTRIRPADFQRISASVTQDGLSFGGEIIPFDAEHTAELEHAVEELSRNVAPEAPPPDSPERAFAKAEKSLQAALSQFERLGSMDLDEDGRLRLMVAVEAGRDHLDRIRLATNL